MKSNSAESMERELHEVADVNGAISLIKCHLSRASNKITTRTYIARCFTSLLTR